MQDFGLSKSTFELLLTVFNQFSTIEKVFLFGSRALETYREGSDLDIAVSAPAMTQLEFARLCDALESLPLIYKIDCLHLESITNEALYRKIMETGHQIY